MPDRDYYERLTFDLVNWNEWRRKTPDETPELFEADLSGKDLRGVDLSSANLQKCDLYKTCLQKATLRRANLSGAYLPYANFIEATLTGANLTSVHGLSACFVDADLRDADLTDAAFEKAELDGANLNGANSLGADFSRATFRNASLFGGRFTGANFSNAILYQADLRKADLRGVDFSKAKLCDANLSEANLRLANLEQADLRGANLAGAILSRANLGDAQCPSANFTGADLREARLININLVMATLNDSWLWEIQRAGWIIKGVICNSVYWDKNRQSLELYRSGEFEKFYSDSIRVRIKYPDGISNLEIVTLPALIKHLEESYPGSRLRFESIVESSGGATATIVVDSLDDVSLEEMEEVKALIQSAAEEKALQLRQQLRQEIDLVHHTYERMFGMLLDKILPDRKTNAQMILKKGDLRMGDTYYVNQAGAVGPESHAHDMTFNQIGSRIEQSMDLTALASELEVLRQALKKEATTEEHDIVVADVGKAKKAAEAKDPGKLAESLKSAGKWALDVATKIGVSLATEAIKQSTEIK